VAVLVPAEAVLVDQPGAGERGCPELFLGYLGCFQGGGDHRQLCVLHREQLAGGCQGGGLASAGGAFDHEK
jgi:hypothetical protein